MIMGKIYTAEVHCTGSDKVTYFQYEEPNPDIAHIYTPWIVDFKDQGQGEFESHCKTAMPIIRRMLDET
jgi:hypothetical protein